MIGEILRQLHGVIKTAAHSIVDGQSGKSRQLNKPVDPPHEAVVREEKAEPFPPPANSASKWLNPLFSTMVISPVITAWKAPVDAYLNSIQTNTPLKRPLLPNLYGRGYKPHAIAGFLRGGICVSAKTLTASEPSQQDDAVLRFVHKHPFLSTFTFSQLELLVSQVYANRGRLEYKQVIIPGQFKWCSSNLWVLQKTGYDWRTVTFAMNYYGVCTLSDWMSARINTGNQHADNFIGGASTGAILTNLTFPFNAAAERQLIRTEYKNGHLKAPSTREFLSEVKKQVQAEGSVRNTAIKLGVIAKAELPTRTVSSMVTFGLIQCMCYGLGPKPLDSIKESISRRCGL